MYTDNDKVNVDSDDNTRAAGFASRSGVITFMLFASIFCLSFIVQADGLFDFQMKLAEKGNAEAEYKVGEMYETGFGVKKDMQQAANWITKAANQGHETAGFKLLYWDMEKNGVTKANKAQVDALKTRAKNGHPQAQYYLGKMHANGVGVEKHHNKAISWLNKAALVGVLAAEREIVLVREEKQQQMMAKRRANEKRRVELIQKQEAERQARLDQQQQLKKQRQAEAAKSSVEKAKATHEAQQESNKAQQEANKLAAENEEIKAELLAQQQAAEKQRLAKEKREAQKQALLKKRAEDKKKRKVQFESDPCSGKSAKFLSTCK